MKVVLFFVWLLLFLPDPGFTQMVVRADYVFDGDTLRVKGNGMILTVRLIGIDAPETGKKHVKGQPFSQKARQFLFTKVTRQTIFLKTYGTDRYNRQLAEVFVDGKNINLEMIKQGLAEVYHGRHPNGFDIEPYVQAEKEARQAQKGIWSLKERYQRPWAWRKKYSKTH